MKLRTLIFIILLFVAAIGAGALRYYVVPTYYPHLLKQSVVTAPSPSPTSVEETGAIHAGSQSIATVSAKLLKDLTPRQKVAQLIATSVVANDSSVASTSAGMENEIPGFVTIFGQRISALQADQLTTSIKQIPSRPKMIALLPNLTEQERMLLRPLVAIDHEGGSVLRLTGEGITTLPPAVEQCKLDRESLKALLDRVGKELRGVGVDIVFAPVIDLAVSHPILKTRVCSNVADTVSTYAEYWVSAMNEQNVIPVFKHYPGIGQTTVDLHLKPETIQLNPIEQRIFLGLLNTFPQTGVMTTHVSLEKEDGKTTAPCTVSAECLQTLQIQQPHFIFTDGLEMGGAQGTRTGSASAQVLPQSLSELAGQSIEAGHNVVVLGKSVPDEEVDMIVTDLADRYQRNPAFKQSVDKALQTVWQLKYDHWSRQE